MNASIANHSDSRNRIVVQVCSYPHGLPHKQTDTRDRKPPPNPTTQQCSLHGPRPGMTMDTANLFTFSTRLNLCVQQAQSGLHAPLADQARTGLTRTTRAHNLLTQTPSHPSVDAGCAAARKRVPTGTNEREKWRRAAITIRLGDESFELRGWRV